jgi:hypothetical protein
MNSSLFQHKKEAFFTSSKRYYQFLNWVSGEFDLFLQDDTNGLLVYFPEGKFIIKESLEKEIFVAHININTTVEKKGEDILEKIMSLYYLLLKLK